MDLINLTRRSHLFTCVSPVSLRLTVNTDEGEKEKQVPPQRLFAEAGGLPVISRAVMVVGNGGASLSSGIDRQRARYGPWAWISLIFADSELSRSMIVGGEAHGVGGEVLGVFGVGDEASLEADLNAAEGFGARLRGFAGQLVGNVARGERRGSTSLGSSAICTE